MQKQRIASADPIDDYSDWRQSDWASEVNDGWFWQLIRGRRSVRRYLPDPVERSLLEMLLTAAIWAPSAHNRQPWRFCVVTSDLVKQELSDRMAARWRADLSADGVDAALIERRLRISHARITGAPALVAASVSLEEMDDYPDRRRQEAEWLMAVQSTALACQNLLLAAHQYGLAACWMCAPLFVPELVRDALGLPDSWYPQSLITLGYAAEEKQRERLPLAERVIWR